MLRPERMSRVSVAGARRVLDDVIETVHDLHLLHLSSYDGSWEGFEPGDPIEGADASSEKLVTTRSLRNILDVDAEDAGPARIVDAEESNRELEDVRERVNHLDDRRDDLEAELGEIDEELDRMETFAALGIDLDLLDGYDTLRTRVGEGNPDEVERALADAEGIASYEVFAADEGPILAAFARPADGSDAEAFEEALVGVDFAPISVPDAEGTPEEVASDLRERRAETESELDEVEAELAAVSEEAGGFLLATEEHLAIDVQKRETPLSFATTENAFLAEGWIPTERYVDLAEALQQEVGDHVAFDELERASYDGDGAVHDRESVGSGAGEPTAADGGERDVRADGGPTVEKRSDGGHAGEERPMAGKPPVVQDNPGPVRPFESLVQVVNRPKYSELDPTVVLFLTFPLFFGFMIGDLGYGLLYMGIGYYIMKKFEGDVIRSLGAIAMWAGGFTALFGVLYGELFGLHQLGYLLWGGSPPIHKGLQPAYIAYAQGWLLASVVAGVLHLVLGRALDFRKNLSHGLNDAILESGSWIVLTVSLWVWIFSETALNAKPAFMFSVFAREGMTNPVTGESIAADAVAIPLGFNGFPAIDLFALPVGGIVIDLALVVALVGLGLVVAGEGAVGLVESITQAFGHVVSYTRLAAVLLAKAGMALAVNLLVFGAYAHDGEFHLITFSSPEEVEAARQAGEIIFAGLFNGEGAVALVLGLIFGVIVLVLGHLLVLVLGITSAGLQAVRLEYVEFFGKFYEGGGDDYEPFGYDRRYTADE